MLHSVKVHNKENISVRVPDFHNLFVPCSLLRTNEHLYTQFLSNWSICLQITHLCAVVNKQHTAYGTICNIQLPLLS